jgi:hypothetical protein
MHIVFAILLFLLALRCLFAKVEPDPDTPGSKYVYEVAWKTANMTPPPRLPMPVVRVFGFLLFTGLGIALLFNR